MSFMGKLVRTSLVTLAFSALCVVGASAACVGVGTVTADALRMRAEASTDAQILATAAKNEQVVILEEAAEGWYKVDYNTVEGYMVAEYLNVKTQSSAPIGYGLVRTGGAALNVRTGPGTEHSQVFSINNGAVVTIIGIDNGWYKIETSKGSTGYVSSDYMITCKDPAGSRGDGQGLPPGGTLGQQVADYAAQFLGCPYVWGGNGPKSFDCSGFTKYVYSHFGYTLNRTASAQLSNGVPVSFDELQPGDLVFFDNGRVSTPVSHVGIYVGGGQFIHASTNKYCVQYDDLSSGHYRKILVYARRIFQ